MSYQDYIRSGSSSLSVTEVLKSDVSVLLGVTPHAEALLRYLGVRTVFDLGVSTIFDNAARVLWAGQQIDSPFRAFGRAPASMIDSDLVRISDVATLSYETIEALIGIGPQLTPRMQHDMAVEHIRDMALWPPYLAAKAIVLEAYNPDLTLAVDPEAPAELLPKNGNSATERFLYTSVVMLPGQYDTNTAPRINNVRFDIVASPQVVFDRCRFGAVLTYAHTWIPRQVAKGQLLHSVPLAPGESTSVAVIDWTNKIAAATRQTLTQSERISSVADRSRTVGQIASAVAREFQSGSSESGAQSSAASGWVAGGQIPFPLVFGSGSANETSSSTHTVSSGERNIDTQLRQNISESTHQVSSSIRGQRAAVVTEVSQRESEFLSTRSLTNYNHMHALTVQYYEVVQMYETQVRLHDYARCLFVPMRLFDFRDERNIFKYLTLLRAAALDEVTRDTLDDLADTDQVNMGKFQRPRVPSIPSVPFMSVVMGQFAAGWASTIRAATRALEGDGFVSLPTSAAPPDQIGLAFRLQLRQAFWDPNQLAGVDIVLEDQTIVHLVHTAAPGASADDLSPDLSAPLSFGEIREIRPRTRDFRAPRNNVALWPVTLRFAVDLYADSAWLDCSFLPELEAQTSGLIGSLQPVNLATLDNAPLLSVETPTGIVQAADLLMEHQLYYSQQVWLRENPQSLIMQLAPFQFTIGGTPINLVDHIAPVPLTVVGNYVVYRFTYEADSDWKIWVANNVNWSAMDAEEVPVPTGGVFAEAVLGRYNAAEKIDLTRFFNWQDSPPPAPPQIAALQAGKHARSTEPALPASTTPTLTVQSPMAFPDASGFSAALSALVTADMFRNMSGAATTGAAGEKALDVSSSGSIEALTAAGEMMTRLMASLASALSSVTSAEGLKTISDVGALLNEKVKQEKSKKDGAATGSGGAGSGSPGSGGATGGSTGGGGQTGAGVAGATVGDLLNDTFMGPAVSHGAKGSTTGDTPDAETDTTSIDATAPGVIPAPNLPTVLSDAAREPSLALLTAYVSQFENDVRVPAAAVDAFARGGVQAIGLKVRHALLESYLTNHTPTHPGIIYDLAFSLSGLHGVASLVCHNVLRTFARGGNFDTMALPWQRLRCGGPPAAEDFWVTYQAGVPKGGGELNTYNYTFAKGTLPDDVFLRPARGADDAACPIVSGMRPSGFYALFDHADFGTDDYGDWYHFFLTHAVAAYFCGNQISDDTSQWIDLLSDSGNTRTQIKYALFIYTAVSTMRKRLRAYHEQHEPANVSDEIAHIYDGWLWANALGMLEGIGYGNDQHQEEAVAQEDVVRESHIHLQGCVAGIDRAVGLVNLIPGSRPNWRWMVPKAGALFERISAQIDHIGALWDSNNFLEFAEALSDAGDELAAQIGDLEQYVYDVWDIDGVSVRGGPVVPSVLGLGEHVPSSSELTASGAFVQDIAVGTPAYNALVVNTNTDIVYKDGDANLYPMTQALSDRLDELAALVAADLAGFKLRVTSTWRERPAGSTQRSLHMEARAADMNIIEDDPAVIAAGDHDRSKLGRLAQLAVEAGFDWVFYEDANHVHASVRQV